MQADEVERGSAHAVRLRAETLQTVGRRLPGGDLHQSNVSGFAALSTPLNNNSRVLEDREKIRVLLRELKETYSDYATRVLFGRIGLELVESSSKIPLPAQRLSDGTLRFLALAAILLQENPPPRICLEEPELGMHPDMIRMVGRMIIDASEKTQIIITTHSEQLLTVLQDDLYLISDVPVVL